MSSVYGSPLFIGGSQQISDLPPLLSNFRASIDESQTGQVILSADKMEKGRAKDLAGAVWVYGEHEPKNVNDGTKAELSRDEIVADSGTIEKSVSWDKKKEFYARQFTYNPKKQYQTMLEGAIAYLPIMPDGQELSKLPSGSKVKLGTWNDTPLQWKVARDTSDQSIRLVLEPDSVSLFGTMAYDVAEPSNSDNDRRSFGNSRYIYSNIHQWLNATKVSGWYTAQHSADAAPAYYDFPGFLSGWSENHIAALDRATLTTSRASIDGGGTETFVARVALISTTELGLQSSTGGGRLDIFNSDGDRATGSYYWSRTPHPSSSFNAYQVVGSGALGNGGNVFLAYGVRPLCKPVQTTLVSAQPDGDGCYTLI